MNRIRYLATGYLRIQVTGEQQLRFFNLCKNRGIDFRNIQTGQEGIMTGSLKAADFFRLRTIRRKTGVHIHILNKRGLPFVIKKLGKHKPACISILAGICVYIFLSTRIWNIHIQGNVIHPTPSLLAFLKEEGVKHGMAADSLDCQELVEALRKKYPVIKWASAGIRGSSLVIEIREGENQNTETENSVSCSLMAEEDGVITRIITRAGVPLFQEGDEVKKGDILVEGRLEIKNDSQEVTGYEYVHADADIYVRCKIPYYEQFPVRYTKEIPDGKKQHRIFLRFGDLQLNLYGKKQKQQRRIIKESPFYLTESLKLPVVLGILTFQNYKNTENSMTSVEAKTLALEHLQLYEENLMEKGVQISENNVKIEINYEVCESRGTLTVITKTGKEVPVEQLPQPKERTPEDG